MWSICAIYEHKPLGNRSASQPKLQHRPKIGADRCQNSQLFTGDDLKRDHELSADIFQPNIQLCLEDLGCVLQAVHLVCRNITARVSDKI